MVDYSWSEREIPPEDGFPGNFWCVRNAFSELMGWEPCTDERLRFIEAPLPGDMGRLVDDLELLWFEPKHEPHMEPSAAVLDHPGNNSGSTFHSMQMSHVLNQSSCSTPAEDSQSSARAFLLSCSASSWMRDSRTRLRAECARADGVNSPSE